MPLPQYVTVEEYRDLLGADADPAVTDSDLRRASRVVDELMIGVPYSIGGDGFPSRPAVRDAISEATAYQANWHVETGDASGVSSLLGGASIGSLQLPKSATDATGTNALKFAPEAVRVLRAQGLLNVVVNH